LDEQLGEGVVEVSEFNGAQPGYRGVGVGALDGDIVAGGGART
jgi:hypothetical protein